MCESRALEFQNVGSSEEDFGRSHLRQFQDSPLIVGLNRLREASLVREISIRPTARKIQQWHTLSSRRFLIWMPKASVICLPCWKKKKDPAMVSAMDTMNYNCKHYRSHWRKIQFTIFAKDDSEDLSPMPEDNIKSLRYIFI